METLRSWGFDYNLGGFPIVVLIGFATYVLFGLTAALTSLKRWSKTLRRVPTRVHRRLAIAALLLGTVHLLIGLSAYV